MTTGFLYERITHGRPSSTGTLAEPDGVPEPRFALQGTVNWMHALALVVQDEGINWLRMQAFYHHVQRLTNERVPTLQNLESINLRNVQEVIANVAGLLGLPRRTSIMTLQMKADMQASFGSGPGEFY